MVDQAAIQDQVDRNFEKFQELLPSIVGEHRGKFALMNNQKIVGYFSSANDARTAGFALYKDGLFSIQKVTDLPVDLGYFSHAVVLR